jgi:flagellar protein FliS
MRANGYQNYLEDQILTANSMKLVELLYRGALDSIAAARRHLRSGDIRSRSQAITKAMSIVTELSLSLDHQAGGSLSRHLEELYGYTEHLLIQANLGQCEAPLIEAERLLSTLLEGWNACTGSQETAETNYPTKPGTLSAA